MQYISDTDIYFAELKFKALGNKYEHENFIINIRKTNTKSTLKKNLTILQWTQQSHN